MVDYSNVSILVVLDHWFGLARREQEKLVGSQVSILVVLDHWFGQFVREPQSAN